MTWPGPGVPHRSWARFLIALVWALGVGAGPASAAADLPVRLSAQTASLPLTDRTGFLVDDTGQWQPGMTPPGTGFAPLAARWSRDNFGTRSANLWFKTTIDTGDSGGGEWLWVVANPHLDLVDITVVVDGQPVARWSGGNASDRRAETVQAHPYLVAPLTLQAGKVHTVYMQVRSSGIFYVPVTLWRPQAFWQSDQTRYALAGLYFGLVAGLSAYNLFLYLLIRERVYLHYLGCILALTLSQLANTGLGAQWVWPAWAASSTFINNMAIAAAAAMAIDRVRQLLDELESKEEIARLVDSARDAQSTRIFIGSENNLFSLSGSSVIAAPYREAGGKVVGVVGVIGPTRLNYARIVPMVDFTAQALSRLIK